MNETIRQVLAELPEIRERADKATPGPWYVSQTHTFSSATQKVVALSGHNRHDSLFIAHAREDVPKLCDALQLAEAEIIGLNASLGMSQKENQRLQAEIERKDQLLNTIESYAGGGSREQEGIGLSAAHIAEMVKRAREGGKRDENRDGLACRSTRRNACTE